MKISTQLTVLAAIFFPWLLAAQTPQPAANPAAVPLDPQAALHADVVPATASPAPAAVTSSTAAPLLPVAAPILAAAPTPVPVWSPVRRAASGSTFKARN